VRQKQAEGHPKNVVRLKQEHAANPQRTAAVRSWHIDQATESNDRPVATLSFTVTELGAIQTRDIGIEPEHAQLLMIAMERAMQKLAIEAGISAVPVLEGPVNTARRRRESDRARAKLSSI